MCVCVWPVSGWTDVVVALSRGKRRTLNVDVDVVDHSTPNDESVGSIEVLLGKQSPLNQTENNKIKIVLITTCTTSMVFDSIVFEMVYVGIVFVDIDE